MEKNLKINFEKTDVFESQNKKKYTSLKFWISDFSNVSPADNVSMSFSVEYFLNFRKIISKWFGLDYDRILCMAKKLKIRDDHVGHEIGSANEILRFSTILKDMRPGIKSITNWIWFEIALIYWKPLFECSSS